MHTYHLLTEDQRDLQLMVRDFVDREIKPRALEMDKKGECDPAVIKMATDMGLHCMNFPEEYGGMGLDAVTCSILREELGKGDAGFAVTIGANILGSVPVLLAGTEEQKKLYADIVVPGGFSPFALTEPGGGSNAANMKTTAVKKGDEYILNGRKCFITNAGIADLYTVFAVTDKEKGTRGISAFLVKRDWAGVSTGKHEDKMGIRTSNTCDVVFEDVHVPADMMLGAEGTGFKLAMQTLDRTRPLGAAGAVGICQAAIDYALEYAKNRVVFNRPIMEEQAIRFMLADMEIQTQAAREMVMRAAYLIDHGIFDSQFGACVKTFCGDTAMKVTTDAVQILGGYGYSREYPVEKMMRDAKIYQIFEGTNQIQRVVIANHMARGK